MAVVAIASMTASIMALPTVPAGWKHGDSVVLGAAPGLIRRTVEPVGKAFQILLRRDENVPLVNEEESSDVAKEDEGAFPGYEDAEPASLLKIEAGNWKQHDLYLILGLGKLRSRATDDEIKRAYRCKVLKHHPDKKASKSKGKNMDDNFFKCVQKAYDILCDPVKRLHFDSIDPTFSDALPSSRITDNFYEVYNEVFASNARFSVKPNVPAFGDDSNDSDHVRAFYDFWYNFESWRVFNWLDEEDTQGAESREEKRYLDRLNEKARAEHKKEDNARIRRLVDQAAALDPRIMRMKQEERQKKEKAVEAKRAAEESARVAAALEAEAIAATQRAAEAAAKAAAEVNKAAREEQKKLVRKERKTLRQHVKSYNCYLDASVGETDAAMFEALGRLDVLVESLNYDDIVAFNAALLAADDNGAEVYLTRIGDRERLAAQQASKAKAEEEARAAEAAGSEADAQWDDKERALLIQAVKLFPGGTINRWGRIAQHVNDHSGRTRPRAEKDVIAEAKNVLKDTGRVHETVMRVERKNDDVAPIDKLSIREDYEVDERAAAAAAAAAAVPTPWTAAEIEGFQSALRSVPTTAENRWDKIAELMQTRSKKECMAKFKEIAALIKDKKGGK